MASPRLPAVSEGNLSGYLQDIRKFPMLEADEEFMLAKRWQEHEDIDAAHKLVTSHLRLVAKIAMGYRGYGLPVSELISEGNVGMMQAVKRFDPDRGFRLATYAMWCFATRRRCEVTSLCAASESPRSRHDLASMYSSSCSSIGNLRISCR